MTLELNLALYINIHIALFTYNYITLVWVRVYFITMVQLMLFHTKLNIPCLQLARFGHSLTIAPFMGWDILGSNWAVSSHFSVGVLEAGKIKKFKNLSNSDNRPIVMARQLGQSISKTGLVWYSQYALVSIYQRNRLKCCLGLQISQISICSNISGIWWTNKLKPKRPNLNLQELKDLLLMSWCQVAEHTFRNLVDSKPPQSWFSSTSETYTIEDSGF